MKHQGSWQYHDDDCLCGSYTDAFCNRGGSCWSCCGACAEDSECSAPQLHPSHWQHPRHHETVASWRNHRPVYRSADEIRALVPEAFAEPQNRSVSALAFCPTAHMRHELPRPR